MSVLRLTAGAAIVFAGVSTSGCDDPGGETQARGTQETQAPGADTQVGGRVEREEAGDTAVPLVLAPPGEQAATADVDAAESSADSGGEEQRPAPSQPDEAIEVRTSDVDERKATATPDATTEDQGTPAIDQLAREMRELAIMALQTRKKLLNLSVSDPFVDETQTLEEVSAEMREIAASSILTRKALLELRFDENGKATAGDAAGHGGDGESRAKAKGDQAAKEAAKKPNDEPEGGAGEKQKASAEGAPK